MFRRTMSSLTTALCFCFLAVSISKAEFTPAACGPCPAPYPAPCLQFFGPAENATTDVYEQWLKNVSSWRMQQRHRFALSDAVYGIDALNWTQSAYVAPQMHPFDLFFYNRSSGSYTPDTFVDDLLQRYGGIDAMLLWPTYPNMGVDDRSQFDWFRSLPGGTEALQRVVQYLQQKHGIHVMVPYNPWDVGTRREDGNITDAVALANLLSNTSTSGINGDTMVDMDRDFFSTPLDRFGIAAAIQPENGGLPFTMNWTTMGWGYWNFPQGSQPCVDADRWVSRKRLTGVCERWAQDKTDNIQGALLNGVGYVSWENVWGTWNGITARGAALIERYAALMRFFQPSIRLLGDSWRPLLTPYFLKPLVFGSSFDTIGSEDEDVHDPVLRDEGLVRVYFLVNRGNDTQSGALLNVTALPGNVSFSDVAMFDCYHGSRIQFEAYHYPLVHPHAVAYATISGRSIGCIAVVRKMRSLALLGPKMTKFMNAMGELTKRPLASYSNEWKPIPQVMEEASPINSLRRDGQPTPSGMLRIPATVNYTFQCEGIEIEGPPGRGVDFQFPWESVPARHHGPIALQINAFDIDERLVTNVDFAVYLNQSQYQPIDTYNFLRNWVHSGGDNNNETRTYQVPPGAELLPVTWVSFDEAAEYCRFYGKRLPKPFEWQYAAQGLTGDATPWARNASKYCTPNATTGNDMPLPPSVFECDEASSVFGVKNLLGFVWQWTSAFHDAHTRAALIKGGSYYRPSGSGWYMRLSTTVDTHNKYLLMSETYDRSGGVGFRCVMAAS